MFISTPSNFLCNLRGPVKHWRSQKQVSSCVTCLIQQVLFPDPTQKLVELAHLTKVGKKGLREQSPGTEDIEGHQILN